MYILVMFIWLQGAGSLTVTQPKETVEPITYQTESLCDEAGQLMPLTLPTDTTIEYSWQSPKCVFVEKPI